MMTFAAILYLPGSALVPDDSCNDYDVRLVGGDNNRSGIVEACYSNDTHSSLWGPICAADGFIAIAWTESTATTICGQLGFSTNSKHSIEHAVKVI